MVEYIDTTWSCQQRKKRFPLPPLSPSHHIIACMHEMLLSCCVSLLNTARDSHVHEYTRNHSITVLSSRSHVAWSFVYLDTRRINREGCDARASSVQYLVGILDERETRPYLLGRLNPPPSPRQVGRWSVEGAANVQPRYRVSDGGFDGTWARLLFPWGKDGVVIWRCAQCE